MLLRPLRSCRQSHANDAFKNEKSYVLDQVIRKSSVPETVCEHESNGRLQSNRDRSNYLQINTLHRLILIKFKPDSSYKHWLQCL